MHKILIADDHPVVLLGTSTFLQQRGYQVISSFANGLEAYNQIVAKQPDIAILDLSMPGMSGMEILEKLSRHKPAIPVKVILMTMHNERALFNRACELGVKGYLLKDFAMYELEKCMEEVIKGNVFFSKHLEQMLITGQDQDAGEDPKLEQLTFAEKKILELVAKQKSTKEIAAQLFISEKTVETHRSHIIKKLDIPPGKNALLIWALKMYKQDPA